MYSEFILIVVAVMLGEIFFQFLNKWFNQEKYEPLEQEEEKGDSNEPTLILRSFLAARKDDSGYWQMFSLRPRLGAYKYNSLFTDLSHNEAIQLLDHFDPIIEQEKKEENAN